MTAATEINLTEHDLSLLPTKREHVRFYRVPSERSDDRNMYGRSSPPAGVRLRLPDNWICAATHCEFGYTWAVIVQLQDGKFPGLPNRKFPGRPNPMTEIISATAEYMNELRPALA